MELKDGRNVTCVVYDGNYSGGISCDWENTTRQSSVALGVIRPSATFLLLCKCDTGHILHSNYFARKTILCDSSHSSRIRITQRTPWYQNVLGGITIEGLTQYVLRPSALHFGALLLALYVTGALLLAFSLLSRYAPSSLTSRRSILPALYTPARYHPSALPSQRVTHRTMITHHTHCPHNKQRYKTVQ